MFKNNKYTTWYYSIIVKAKNQPRSRKQSYYEIHHIIPKSLGGTNNKNNLVLLTPKEHFVVHLLLTKMPISINHIRKMCHAFTYLSSRKSAAAKNYTSRLYAYHRLHCSRIKSEQYTGEGNPFYGKKHSEELKKWFSENNPTKREDVKQKMRKPKNCSNRHVPCSEEKKKTISANLKGHKQSEETKQKKRIAKADLIWIYQVPNKPKQIKIFEKENYPDWKKGRGPQQYW